MKPRPYLATAFLAAVTLLTPLQASALSVRQYESQSRDQRATTALNAINKIIADVAPVDPDLSKAIHDYFELTPPNQDFPPGIIAFAGELAAVEDLADKGKMDLDKVQIEGIMLDLVKTDILPKFAKNAPPSPPAQP